MRWLGCVLGLVLAAGCGSEDAGAGEAGVDVIEDPMGGEPLDPGPADTPTAGAMAPGGTAGEPSVPPPATGEPAAGDPVAGDTDPTQPADIATDCQGFELAGLQHSPGGNVLPNTCEPFDPTTNNPYAVRCIDAWDFYDTGFLGDEYCILPPPPELGIQVGFHPMEGAYWEQVPNGDLSGYEAPPAEWVLPPGGEETRNYQMRAGNTEPNAYYRTYFRMRTGSHHNIISLHDASQLSAGAEVGWIPTAGDALPGLFAGNQSGVLGGQQRPDDGSPQSFEPPPEDEGNYLNWPTNPYVVFNLHHFNTWDEPTLKEGWVNVWWQSDQRTQVNWYMGLEPLQVVTLSMSPGQVSDFHYYWPIDSNLRLIRVFGHRHLWTSNFSSWIERASGETELIYQSFDWFDMPTFRYDSVVENPAPNPDLRVDGAASGVLELNPGDELHFNCHMAFTDERAAAEDVPPPAEVGRVRFANEVLTGEMCIMFGNVSGGRLGLPAASAEPVPEFATVD